VNLILNLFEPEILTGLEYTQVNANPALQIAGFAY
jgi:hypothetical protein